MLRSIDSLLGYTIAATDGNVGKSQDFLFHDNDWAIRYLVVDTGDWLPGRKVLLTPEALGSPNFVGKIFPVELTCEQIEKSPPLEKDKPVSRQHEHEIHLHYAWPAYWGAEVLGPPASATEQREPEGDSHLRSAKEVSGYHIEATDGKIGHVEDFIVDDDAWVVRYLVIDTKNWLPGRKVLVSPQWADSVSWTSRQVKVGLSREAIEKSPEYDPNAPVNREYEERLYDFYGRPQYWTETTTKI